ncbi:MAG TPA: VOC family protein [Gemmatimonadales bacterium]|jgi:hypothetical protein
MAGQFPRGRFVWHELNTTNPKAAIPFYTKVLPWQTQAWEQQPSYLMWMAGKTSVGGLLSLTEDERRRNTPPYWLPYIATPDADATTRRAVELGGKVASGPIDMPTVGRFTVLQDPQGAFFAAFRPAGEDSGKLTDPRLGEFSWHELATSDPRSAWAFYETLFAWKKTSAMDRGPAGMYQMFSTGGPPAGGIYAKPAAMALAASHWLPYMRVGSVDRAAQVAVSLGGKLTSGPMDVPGGGRIAMLLDPQGGPFAVHAIKGKGSRSRGAAKPKAKKQTARKAAKKKPKVKAKGKKKR